MCLAENRDIIEAIRGYQPCFWFNKSADTAEAGIAHASLDCGDINEAAERLRRFAPLLSALFPELESSGGIIESDLIEIPGTKEALKETYSCELRGRLFLKCDNDLPVAGSVKARGGIYEVLTITEELAVANGLITATDDFAKLADTASRRFFEKHSLVVGSTGNLGMSVGIAGAAFGYDVTVHMSRDAMAWKKRKLRDAGVRVIEHEGDYSAAVATARSESENRERTNFIDDENSINLFLGYSVAALRLKEQLRDRSIDVDGGTRINVYVPCGVGGAPGGICFGLKCVFGDRVRCFFAEPTHSPCMLVGLITGRHDSVDVRDFGLDGVTEADGLAVARPSRFVGKAVERLVDGVYTVSDEEMFALLACINKNEGLYLEPSATPGLIGPVMLERKRAADGRHAAGREASDTDIHIAWATGGSFVPKDLRRLHVKRGAAAKSMRI